MPFDFRFKFVEDEKEINKLKTFLLSQSFDYPLYFDWVERAICEIDSGYKRTILAFNENNLVGNLIFQPHKTLLKTIEIKNIRVHPDFKRRYFSSFMLRQVEAESMGYNGIIVDTRSDRLEILNLFHLSGYKEIARSSLYEPNVEDIIFFKKVKLT